jgi:hypothetical protein
VHDRSGGKLRRDGADPVHGLRSRRDGTAGR